LAELLAQNPVLLAQVIDDLVFPLVHPSGPRRSLRNETDPVLAALSFTHYRELGPGPELSSIQVVPVSVHTVTTQPLSGSIKLLTVTPQGATFGPPGYEVNLLYIACFAALGYGRPRTIRPRGTHPASPKGSWVSKPRNVQSQMINAKGDLTLGFL
jgi:hypothetical protein